MKCTKCKHKISNNDLFCSECGASQEIAKKKALNQTVKRAVLYIGLSALILGVVVSIWNDIDDKQEYKHIQAQERSESNNLNSTSTESTKKSDSIDNNVNGAKAIKNNSMNGRDVLQYVSSNLWTIWGGECKSQPIYLSATYSPENGQMLYKNGELVQTAKSFKQKHSFGYEFNTPGSFTYRQTVYVGENPIIRQVLDDSDSIVTDITEMITLETNTTIRVVSDKNELDSLLAIQKHEVSYKQTHTERVESICNP